MDIEVDIVHGNVRGIRSLDAMQGRSDTDSNIIKERLTIIRA